MPIPIEEGQPDSRLPGFGSGLSFGMLGPTRVVLSSGSLPPILQPYALVCLAFEEEEDNHELYAATWRGHWSDGTDIALTIQVFDLYAGSWVMQCSYHTGIPPTSRHAQQEFTNFQWQMPPFTLAETGVGGFLANCYRLREWEYLYDRFPGCVIPDIA